MRKPFLVLVLALAAGAHAVGQQPTFQTRADLVTVDVVVFDTQGNPVEGLTAGDFTVREDGRPQSIAAFEAVSLLSSPPTTAPAPRVSTNAETPDAAGRWFFIVFDDVNITQFATPRAREAIAQFIREGLRPGDRVMIAPASGGSNWTGELPQDREDLLAFIDRLQGERRVDRGPDRLLDTEAMDITLRNDRQALAQVMRRYYENDVILEAAALPSDPGIRAAVDVSPGEVLVQAKARQTFAEARSRMQVTLGTLDRMAQSLASARGRKTLLLVSEGFIADSALPVFRGVIQTARNANVAIHFVDVRAPGGPFGQPGLPGGNAEAGRATEDRDATIALALASRDADGTRSIASDTGGTTVTGTNLLDGLQRVAREGRAFYLLGYAPANTRSDGRFRKIEVTVNRPGVTVRARGGYFGPSSDRDEPRTDPDTLDPDVRAALDSPFGAPGIPMRLTSYALGPQVGGTVRTLLVAEADPSPLRLQPRDGRYTATLDSYVLVHDRARGSLERNERVIELNMPAAAWGALSQRGIPLQREFDLAPGHYQATVLVSDRKTGTIGSVRHEFEVPAAREFRITTPIVTDLLQPATGQGQPRPVPIASRMFTAGARIAAAFEVFGASAAGTNPPAVSVAYQLKRRDGATVAAIPPQTLKPNAAGQFAVTIGITLPPNATGDHELVLSVRDEQATRVIEHVELLNIVP